MNWTPPDLLLDQALDAALAGDDETPTALRDPELAALVELAVPLRAALADVPPPPRGLRPGRAALLAAAARSRPQPARRRPRLPTWGGLWHWVGPALAVVLLAVMLTFMLRYGNIRPVVPGSVPPQVQSIAPFLFPDATPTPTPTPTPTSTPTPTPSPTPTPTPTATPSSTPTPPPTP